MVPAGCAKPNPIRSVSPSSIETLTSWPSKIGCFDFNAENDSDDPFDASGYFQGESPFGPAITLKGPITCLSIDVTEHLPCVTNRG